MKVKSAFIFGILIALHPLLSNAAVGANGNIALVPIAAFPVSVTVDVLDSKGNTKSPISFQEYLQGVCYAEVGNKQEVELYKAQAIASANTFLNENEFVSQRDSNGKKHKRWRETVNGVVIHHVIASTALQAWKEEPGGYAPDIKNGVDGIFAAEGKAVTVMKYDGEMSAVRGQFWGKICNVSPRYSMASGASIVSGGAGAVTLLTGSYDFTQRFSSTEMSSPRKNFHNDDLTATELSEADLSKRKTIKNGGLGMCQNGAMQMASSSALNTHEVILKHFYHPAPPYIAYVKVDSVEGDGSSKTVYEAAWNLIGGPNGPAGSDPIGVRQKYFIKRPDDGVGRGRQLNVEIVFSEQMLANSISVSLLRTLGSGLHNALYMTDEKHIIMTWHGLSASYMKMPYTT